MNNTQRFTERVDNYVRYRPGYPVAILDYLKDSIGLNPQKTIADIGSGTGISTGLFLKNDNTVYGVEPNDAMRNKAEELLKDYSRFISINGTAENTTLKDNSVDVILAGQAFHWFNIEETKKEFARIATQDGYIVLMWNIRENDSDFSKAYEALLQQFGTDYKEVGHQKITKEDKLAGFFEPQGFQSAYFDNNQIMDFEALKGRLLSSSYIPDESATNYEEMMEALRKLFDTHSANGTVNFGYVTKVFTGKAK